MSREWMDQAACAPDWKAWDGLDVPGQIRTCWDCPVLDQCREWAADTQLYRVVAGGKYWGAPSNAEKARVTTQIALEVVHLVQTGWTVGDVCASVGRTPGAIEALRHHIQETHHA